MEDQILSLAEARGAQAEVFGSEETRTVVEFRANEFHSQESRLTHGHGLRVVKGGRVGFSSSSNPDKVGELVDAAFETAEFGKQCCFEFPGPEPSPAVKTFENRVIVLPALKMIEWGRELVDAVRARVPGLKLDVTLDRTYGETVVANSAGLNKRFARANLQLSATGLLVNDGLVWISEFENLSSGSPPSIGALADRIEERAILARSRARLATGTYPVVFMPTAVPDLLYPLLVGVGGKQLEKGVSPLIDKVGRKLVDEKITIADNGLRDFGTASAPFDAEGVPRRRIELFDRGVFNGFLFDLATAGACGAESTGSAVRDYTAQPQPGKSNIQLLPGAARLNETLAGIRHGLLVHECIGGGQSNVLAGDVALNVSSGHLIENGKVTGRVKDTMIAGNVYEMFANVAAVGDTVRDLGSYHVPFVMFPRLKVATRD
ncbi:TldD/PmbA family protein [candidate division WOR-3 bacterium]|uniref:TldD/PmbA family protein n=1 Tax=candidate division WOR-3 bacterium TaxID=2052148 RepID=A0A937XJ97_UNCW3|nr:TldD/PmbA family protein [candidate division WOR-3 bacterium]